MDKTMDKTMDKRTELLTSIREALLTTASLLQNAEDDYGAVPASLDELIQADIAAWRVYEIITGDID